MRKKAVEAVADPTPVDEPKPVDEKLALVAGAAFPVYHMTGSRDDLAAAELPEYAGRAVHLFQQAAEFGAAEFSAGVGDRDELAEMLNPADVLWVPLYRCGVNKRVETWPAPRAEFYDEAIQLLQLLAPRVAAVIIGNMGPETCWFNRDNSFCPTVLPFVRDTALLVRDYGGRPAYGTVDWDLLVDCYRGGSQMQEAMLEVDALQVCYCGYTLPAGTHYDRSNSLHADQSRFILKHDTTRERLAAYLSPLDIWSGLNFVDGLRAGNDKALAELGFGAGLIG